MKRRFIMLVFTLCFSFTIAATSSNAQSRQSLTFDVPFSFIVEGKTIQAGRYILERFDASSPGTLVLKGGDGRKIKTFRTTRVEVSEPQPDGKLIFMRYDQDHFLSEVWTGGERNGRRVPRCAAENELRQQGRTGEVMNLRLKR